MAGSDYEIDDLDRQILKILQKDARTPFLEIARDLGVSGGTIHQRVDRLRANGVILGSRFLLDPVKLGFGVTALIGLHLTRAQDYPAVLESIESLPAVIEAHYTTGSYALMIKVCARSMNDLYEFLTHTLQTIEGIRSTETFICLSSPIQRSVNP